MACRDTTPEPDLRQRASIQAAKHLSYVLESLGQPVEVHITTTANSEYGDVNYLDIFTARLCDLLTGLTKRQANKIIYDGRNPDARALAGWWQAHQEMDRQREAKEQAAAEAARLVESAKSKLSAAEFEALCEFAKKR